MKTISPWLSVRTAWLGVCLIMGVGLCVGGYVWFQVLDQAAVSSEMSKVEAEVSEDAARVYTERFRARVDRVDVVFEQSDYTHYLLQTNGLVREGDLNTERGFEDDSDATVYVLNWQKPEGEQLRYVRLTAEPDRLYFLDTENHIVRGSVLMRE